MKSSASAFRRNVIVVDAGPLAAAIDREDEDHAWAVKALSTYRGRFLTTETAIAEAQHVLRNDARAVALLSELCSRMQVSSFSDRISEVFGEVIRFAPQMDFADACAVLLVRAEPRGFVLTTDFSDFATYRVPFASPEGEFFG